MANQDSKARDLILLALLALLVILAFIPEKRSQKQEGLPEAARDTAGGTGSSAEEDLMRRGGRAVEEPARLYDDKLKHMDIPETAARSGSRREEKPLHLAAPVKDVPHLFLPLVKGSRWTYELSGSPSLTKHKSKWTLEVVDPPTEEHPGLLKGGFDGNLLPIEVQLKKGGIAVDSLPFLEPPDHLGNKPTKVLGELLPMPDKIVEGAVWRNEYKRDVLYDYYDDKGRMKRVPADALQTDRAQATELEQIPSPAGIFDTRRIEWVSRLALKVSGRQILAPLTTEPYRYETMWVAPGYGIVRRKISYAGSEKNELVLDLVEYTRPEK